MELLEHIELFIAPVFLRLLAPVDKFENPIEILPCPDVKALTRLKLIDDLNVWNVTAILSSRVY